MQVVENSSSELAMSLPPAQRVIRASSKARQRNAQSPSKAVHKAMASIEMIQARGGKVEDYLQSVEVQQAQAQATTLKFDNAESLATSTIHSSALSDTTTSSQCWLRTKGENFKTYRIYIDGDSVVLSRPKSAKQSQLKYKLSKLQCTLDLHSNSGKIGKGGAQQYIFCLLLISAPNLQRSVYFPTRETLEFWHEKLLEAQGYGGNNRIDQYEMLQKLGQGTFGTVYLGKHRASGVKAAIKIMVKASLKNSFQRSKEGFQEVQILEECTKSRASNVLGLIETFEDSEHLFIVTEFIPGGDLLHYLTMQPEQPLNEEQAKRVILQVCIGVKRLHELNIIHRDIKVENILMSDLTDNSQLTIGDLGSAVMLASPEKQVTFQIGTPGYIAPEIILGHPYSFGCDIWSMGCLLHVLLTAQQPFWEDDRTLRNHKVCYEFLDLEANPFTARLSQDCKHLLSWMLRKDPTLRPTVSQLLQHQWFWVSDK